VLHTKHYSLSLWPEGSNTVQCLHQKPLHGLREDPETESWTSSYLHGDSVSSRLLLSSERPNWTGRLNELPGSLFSRPIGAAAEPSAAVSVNSPAAQRPEERGGRKEVPGGQLLVGDALFPVVVYNKVKGHSRGQWPFIMKPLQSWRNALTGEFTSLEIETHRTCSSNTGLL